MCEGLLTDKAFVLVLSLLSCCWKRRQWMKADPSSSLAGIWHPIQGCRTGTQSLPMADCM